MVQHYMHLMILAPYLVKTNQETPMLFYRTDFVKRDGSTILIKKDVESEESGWGMFPPLPKISLSNVPWFFNILDLKCTQYPLSGQKPGKCNQFLKIFKCNFQNFLHLESIIGSFCQPPRSFKILAMPLIKKENIFISFIQ